MCIILEDRWRGNMTHQEMVVADDIINKLISAGYGWKKYAESVSKQTSITDKQAATLCQMYTKLRNLQSAAESRKQWKPSMKCGMSYVNKHLASLDVDQIGDWGFTRILRRKI
jgi:hypothetical protein